MSRYIREIKVGQPIDVVSMIMEDYMYHHRFRRNDWNGEMVYYMKDKHGKERYMKWSYTNGVFHLEAWLKNAFGGESNLKGFGSTASKNEFRQSLEILVSTVKRQAASSISSGHVGSDPLHHTSNHAAEHRAQRRGQQMSFGTIPGRNQSAKQNTNRNTNSGSSLIYAVVALMLSSIPILGIIISLVCLRRIKADKGSNVKVARILCTLALFIAIMTLFTSVVPYMLIPMFDFF